LYLKALFSNSSIPQNPSTNYPCRLFEKLYLVLDEMFPIHLSIFGFILEAHGYDSPCQC
jgi:hypothetical protein